VAVALVLVVSLLALEAVSLFILLLLFRLRFCGLLRDREGCRELRGVNVACDGNRNNGVVES
jgi:hypothetical protein